jgi:hypothetical protein
MANYDNSRNRPFGRDQERRQWSRWEGIAEGNPDRRPDSDAEALEAQIETIAATYRRASSSRDDRGRWQAGGRSDPARDVRIYLTRETYGLTRVEIGLTFGLATRKAIGAALRRGRELVEAGRDRNKNEPARRPQHGWERTPGRNGHD